MQGPASFLRQLANVLGVEHNTTTHREKCIAGSGALLACAVVLWLPLAPVLPAHTAGGALVLASLGATAVLLFVVPHGALSQPWPVLAGHLVSALIGVACREWLPVQWVAASLAVALSILAMQYLRCVHPPGGATALAAVVGGPELAASGWGFVLNPVLLNVAVLLAMALAYNNLFAWRRYPAFLSRRQPQAARSTTQGAPELTQEDFAAAMHALDTFVDIGTEELVELVELARRHAEEQRPHPASIEPGRCYSNGRLGRHWSVRQVLDWDAPESRKRRVIYKTMAGDGAWDTGICGYEEFRLWARFEVECRAGRWVRSNAAPVDTAA